MEEVSFTEEIETATLRDRPAAGWTEFLTISGHGDDPEAGMSAGLGALEEALRQEGLSLSGLVRLVLYIADMSDYAAINMAYGRYFRLNPPVRVCVAVGRDKLPPGTQVVIEARHGPRQAERICLHVQVPVPVILCSPND